MKKLLAALILATPFFTTSAFADDAANSPQQNKMKNCNIEAGDKKGDARKDFMKECLSAKPPAKPVATQQNKMRSCNKEVGDKKGEERKAFMKDCLSNK